jgi:nucleoid-associated protein
LKNTISRRSKLSTVNFAVIHKLNKQRHGQASATLKNTVLDLSPTVIKLVDDIHQLYTLRTGKGYGRFHTDEVAYPTSRILREAIEAQTKSLLESSQELITSVLIPQLNQAQLSTGGYVLMAQVSNEANISWFIIAMINNIQSSQITESLDIIDSIHVDLQNLRVVGRINVTDWLDANNDSRYIGFLKQRGDVADYFKKFLGCDDLVASAVETKKLVNTLKTFAKLSIPDTVDQESFLQSAMSFCSNCQSNNQPLSLEALSNHLWPEAPHELQAAFNADDVQISDGFVPDGRGLKGLVKIKAKTPYWSLEVDRKALTNGQAVFDPENNTLTLSELPAALIAELKADENEDG